MTQTTCTTDLLRELEAGGWRPGPPPQLHSEDVMDDLASYAGLECEVCGHMSQSVQPYHRERSYLLVCVCRRCGHAVEM